MVDQVGFVFAPLFYHARGAARTAWVHVSHRLARSSRTAAPATCFEVVRDTLLIRYHPVRSVGDLDIILKMSSEVAGLRTYIGVCALFALVLRREGGTEQTEYAS